MDDKVRAIQQRLRQQFGSAMAPGQRFDDVPIVTFDEVAGLPAGGEAFVARLLAELKGRGWRVAHVVRSLSDASSAEAAEVPVVDAKITVEPGRLTVSRAIAQDEALNTAMDAVREGFDIVIGQNFGFALVPRVLMTRRVQEGFNLGLPYMVAYVSDVPLDVAIPHFTALDVEAVANFVEDTLGLEHRGTAAEEKIPAEPLETV